MAGLVYARKNRNPQISFAARLGIGPGGPLPACAAVIVADFVRDANGGATAVDGQLESAGG
jgi:hypothetical protein